MIRRFFLLTIVSIAATLVDVSSASATPYDCSYTVVQGNGYSIPGQVFASCEHGVGEWRAYAKCQGRYPAAVYAYGSWTRGVSIATCPGWMAAYGGGYQTR